MKIKLDFVTNSSSTCFLLVIPENISDELKESIEYYNDDPEGWSEGTRSYLFTNKLKELQEFTNDGPLDWASLPGGPQFHNLSENDYNEYKEIIENGDTVVKVWVDYNVCESFENRWKNYIIRTVS
jgi:hypothetical protein